VYWVISGPTDLQVPGFLHRLDRVIGVDEELTDRLGERRFPRAGGPGDEDAPLVFGKAGAEFVGVLVVVEVGLDDGSHGGNLHGVGEGRPGDGDTQVPELDDAHAGFVEFEETVG